jgi:hypothetical protein
MWILREVKCLPQRGNMSKFYTDSSGTKAIRLSDIKMVFIKQEKEEFHVLIKTSWSDELFEIANTLEAAQAIASPILEALEA